MGVEKRRIAKSFPQFAPFIHKNWQVIHKQGPKNVVTRPIYASFLIDKGFRTAILLDEYLSKTYN
jgi:hypothetical protein